MIRGKEMVKVHESCLQECLRHGIIFQCKRWEVESEWCLIKSTSYSESKKKNKKKHHTWFNVSDKSTWSVLNFTFELLRKALLSRWVLQIQFIKENKFFKNLNRSIFLCFCFSYICIHYSKTYKWKYLAHIEFMS